MHWFVESVSDTFVAWRKCVQSPSHVLQMVLVPFYS